MEIINQELHVHVYQYTCYRAKGFVLRAGRTRKAEKTWASTEHEVQRTVDLNYYDCAYFLLIKICFRRKKAKQITLMILTREKELVCIYNHRAKGSVVIIHSQLKVNKAAWPSTLF